MKLDRELADSILKLRPYAAFQRFVDAIQQDVLRRCWTW